MTNPIFGPLGKPIVAPGNGYIAEPSKRPIASDAEISIQNYSLELWISRVQLFRNSRCLQLHMSLGQSSQSDNELGAVTGLCTTKQGVINRGFWTDDRRYKARRTVEGDARAGRAKGSAARGGSGGIKLTRTCSCTRGVTSQSKCHIPQKVSTIHTHMPCQSPHPANAVARDPLTASVAPPFTVHGGRSHTEPSWRSTEVALSEISVPASMKADERAGLRKDSIQPRSRYYVGPPPPGSAFGTRPQGVVGRDTPREIIR